MILQRMLMTCFISSIPQGSQLQCKLLQETVYNTLLRDQPTYVASFGNSDVNIVGDWVKILNTKPSDEVEWTVLFTVTVIVAVVFVVVDYVWDNFFSFANFPLSLYKETMSVGTWDWGFTSKFCLQILVS